MSVTLDEILKKRFDRLDSFDVVRWLVNSNKTINKTEEMSLLSLLAYTAIESETSIETLQKTFLDSFGITRVEQLRADDYNDAVTFIMGWNGDDQEEPAQKIA